MNKDRIMEQLWLIYGRYCAICNNTNSEIFIHLVPLKTIRYARNLNKRKNRKHKRILPELSNYQLNNLLPVCKVCQINYAGDIYKFSNTNLLERIDKVRIKFGFPELVGASNTRKLHKLLTTNNIDDERKNNAS